MSNLKLEEPFNRVFGNYGNRIVSDFHKSMYREVPEKLFDDKWIFNSAVYLYLAAYFANEINDYFKKKHFVEIGAGIGITAISLAKLNWYNGIAFDVDETDISIAKKMARKVKAKVDFKVADFYDWKKEDHEKKLIIACRPALGNGDYSLEEDIVNHALERHTDLALYLTTRKEEDVIKRQRDRSVDISERLKSAGFEVLLKPLPLMLGDIVLATYNPKQ